MGSADTDRLYMCIDLKCFYASVECADLGLDPFMTPLVVADGSRGKGAITLAISPALKKLGVKNRSRLFQIPPYIEYLTVKPHMKRYMQVSAEIYGTLLKYVAPEDVHVYSIDEYFIDITPYLPLYKKDASSVGADVTRCCARGDEDLCHRWDRNEFVSRQDCPRYFGETCA